MLVLSFVIGPPDVACRDLSLVVRSGLITVQVLPSSVLLNKRCDAAYSVLGACGENSSGKVHWKRSFRSSAGCPMGLSGHGVTLRSCPVRWSYRVVKPPYDPANTTLGSLGSGAIQPLSPPPTSNQARSSLGPSVDRKEA